MEIFLTQCTSIKKKCHESVMNLVMDSDLKR
jgi:hypothetical protein